MCDGMQETKKSSRSSFALSALKCALRTNCTPCGDTKVEYIMKNTIKLIALLAIGAGGLVTLTTGCAGTATRQSTGEYVDDAAITAKVKAAFVKDEVIKAMQVDVTTFKGNVQLSGFVDTAEQKARAGQVAATVENVTNVTNNLTVK